MCKPSEPEKRVLAAETIFHTFQLSRVLSDSFINFDTPVNFTEMEILSPLMYLSTSNGGLILGATEPTHFPIKFSCNNIHAESTDTYQSLGTLEYDENLSRNFKCSTNIWSDKLIVSGQFVAITIVVYGTPKDSEVKSVQKKDRRCNLPLFPSSVGAPDIMALENNRFLDSNLIYGLSNLQLDTNYY